MWAEHSFSLNKTDKSGVTQKEHLEQVERQIGQKPTELIEPCAFPSLLSNVWSAFCVLSNHRPPSFSGISPIGFEQIKAYIELTENRIKPWEVDIILKLDEIYLKVANE